MPALIAPLLGFLLGALLSWVAADELRRGSQQVWGSRSLVVVTLFGLLVYAPACAVLFSFGPDWWLGYLVSSQRVPAGVTSGLVLADAASVPAGFVVAAQRGAAWRVEALVRIGILPALLAIGAALGLHRRLGVDASYAQYHGGFGVRPLGGSRLGLALLWSGMVLLVATIWTVRHLQRLGRAAGRRAENPAGAETRDALQEPSSGESRSPWIA